MSGGILVYHGSTCEIRRPDVLHSKRYLDFGMGFYVTTIPQQAEKWALRRGMRSSRPAVVNVYEMKDVSTFRVLRFSDTNSEWLRFVVACRNGEDVYKGYDVVIGNVADDDVFKCVGMFMSGVWDEERTLAELRYYKRNDQIAFLSQKAIDDTLVFSQSYEVA